MAYYVASDRAQVKDAVLCSCCALSTWRQSRRVRCYYTGAGRGPPPCARFPLLLRQLGVDSSLRCYLCCFSFGVRCASIKLFPSCSMTPSKCAETVAKDSIPVIARHDATSRKAQKRNRQSLKPHFVATAILVFHIHHHAVTPHASSTTNS